MPLDPMAFRHETLFRFRVVDQKDVEIAMFGQLDDLAGPSNDGTDVNSAFFGEPGQQMIEKAVAALSERLDGELAGSAKFVLSGEGTIMIDANGVRAGDEEADVVLTADASVFQQVLEGELNPTAAFMTGQLTVDGDMGIAMQLANVLS